MPCISLVCSQLKPYTKKLPKICFVSLSLYKILSSLYSYLSDILNTHSFLYTLSPHLIWIEKSRQWQCSSFEVYSVPPKSHNWLTCHSFRHAWNQPLLIKAVMYLAGIASSDLGRERVANSERCKVCTSNAHPLFGTHPTPPTLKSKKNFLRISVNPEGTPENTSSTM